MRLGAQNKTCLFRVNGMGRRIDGIARPNFRENAALNVAQKGAALMGRR
jgi:hypothetical protein